MISAMNEEWTTPADLFAELKSIFRFTLDACATPANAKCKRFFTRKENALRQEWRGTVWMNPPYGREIGLFVQKAYDESCKGATVVCLLPSSTDTYWWHRWVKRGQVIYLRGRLRFRGARENAPFPAALVIFWGGRLGDAIRPFDCGDVAED